jgi:DNA-binding transcriptional LysR family regulator
MDRRLRQFLAVAETGNVSAAAEVLHVSQPTVSVNIRRLEEEHGVQLFKRSSRGVQLTDFGQVLFEHVKIMARLDDHAKAEIQNLKLSAQKAMRIATGFAWWSLFMRDIFNTYRHGSRGVSLHIDVCSSLDGLRNLLSGDIACFVGTKVAHLNDTMGFEFEHLFSVEDAFFVRGGHPLMGQEHTTADLSQYPKLDVAPFVNRHHGIVERTNDDPKSVSLPPSQAGLYTTNSMTAGIDILSDTDAILTYPIVCAPYFEQHGITMLNVSDRQTKMIEIGIYRLAQKTPDQQLSNVIDLIRQSADRLFSTTRTGSI